MNCPHTEIDTEAANVKTKTNGLVLEVVLTTAEDNTVNSKLKSQTESHGNLLINWPEITRTDAYT